MTKLKRGISKIISLCMTFAVLSGNVYAESLTFSLNPDDSITVSGNSGASLKRNAVTLYITNQGDGSVRAMSKSVNADGSFEFVWLPKMSGEYLVEARAGNVYLSETYWYASVKEYEEIMSKLKTGDKDAVLSVITDSEKLNKIGMSYEAFEGYDFEKLAKALCVIRDYTGDSEKVLELFDDAKPLSVFYEKKTAEAFAMAKEVFGKYEIELSNYEFYTAISDEELKEKITKNISEKLENGIENADSVFTDCIILTAVKECGSWSMLDDYLKLLAYDGYDSSKYKDEAAKAVAGESFKDTKALKDEIDEAIEKAKKNANKNTGSGGGGSSSASSGSGIRPVSVPAPIKKEEVQEEAGEKVVFSDVTESHWAFEAINYLRWEGVVSGSDFNNFYPENTVTRAEMTAMLTRAYGITGGASSFSDVEQNKWYYNAISAAFSKGLVSGDGETFRPDDKVTRQDMAAMIYRFSKNAGKSYDSSELAFVDSDDISEYAKEAVAALSGAGIINGIDGMNFAPLKSATRAQAAQMIYRAIKR